MKLPWSSPLPAVAIIILTAGVLFTTAGMLAQDKKTRLQNKAAKVQTGVRARLQQGGDPSDVLAVVDQVKPALQAGDPDRAEVLLDRALTLLSADAKTINPLPLPAAVTAEPTTNLFIHPEPVAIEGYNGSAMEPFFSPDGRFLFFNNENDAGIDTNLHFAARTGKLTFHYEGELPGVNSKSLDAVPSLDIAGHFYFTTLRDYDQTMNSIYRGDFDGQRVRNIHPVPGNISPKLPGSVNMDAGISPDGKTLYVSRAVIAPGAPAPEKSDILIAHLADGTFTIDPETDRIMRRINTKALEYAPAISNDGLELYFTRADQTGVRIMVATRISIHEPFGEPRVLSALTGFVEAPTVSIDGRELFFHKKVGQKCSIYRAERRSQ